jgi:hypothetical protein
MIRLIYGDFRHFMMWTIQYCSWLISKSIWELSQVDDEFGDHFFTNTLGFRNIPILVNVEKKRLKPRPSRHSDIVPARKWWIFPGRYVNV